MARLTLSFKGQKLKIFTLETTESFIGRDDSCAIFIDSLAIAPHHATLLCSEEGCRIEPIVTENIVLVNGARIESAHVLEEGDDIQVGKHTLKYSAEPVSIAGETPDAPSQTTLSVDTHGWLQIQSGSHLGRTIRLNKAFTRIGNPDSHLAVIAHRNDGYYLSHLNGEHSPRVNDRDTGDSTYKLCHGDRVNVGELQVQFFSDSAPTRQENHDMNETPPHTEQRKFSRIPFDVSVTLHLDDARWETTLTDISLHGALILTPERFEPVMDAQYQLEIHLEGGPDITMETHVAHQEAGHTGMRCDDIDVDSITHLRRLVELNLGDPKLLERELSALTPAEPA